MGNQELAARAAAAGVATSYLNWRDERVQVSDDTLGAVLAALGPKATGRAGRPGPPDPGEFAAALLGRISGSRRWGFSIQLYALRSPDSWGHGDLRDLADFAAWSGADLGADFVSVNPLCAAEPVPPVSASPYLPMTRRYISPLYLRVEDVPEMAMLSPEQAAQIERLAAPLRAQSTTAELIDRNAVWSAKRTALELIAAVPLAPERQAAFDRFRADGGADLARWAAWCALAERHGPDWRRWPGRLRTPAGGLSATAAGELASRARFHAWLQWLADDQQAAAQRAALAAGMRTGIVGDLPVGSHPGGADAWAGQDVLLPGVTVGAPPDGFNQLGQDWGLPAWHPRRLEQVAYRPLADLFGAGFRQRGGLRVDHVMALMRLWCIPDGMPPHRGTYLSYDQAAGVAALSGSAARAGGVVIGEDLGTVDPAFRRQLAAAGVLGTTMIWFAHEPDGTPLRPAHWRRLCLATVGTHDMPTVAGFLTGEQVTIRSRLGLLSRPEQAERAAAELMLSQWRDVLASEGLLAADDVPGAAELTVALHALLTRTPAALIGVSLADAVGEVRAQNMPGTSDEYPNWRLPLCDGNGSPVQLPDLAASSLLRAVASAVSSGLSSRRLRQPAGSAVPWPRHRGPR